MGTRNKSINLYRSLEEISVFRFDKAVNGDLRYLAKKEDVTSISIGDAYEEAWKEIFNEYVEKAQGTNIIKSYLLIGEINYLKSRLYIVPQLVKTVLGTSNNDAFKYCLREIELWGFRIDRSKGLDDQMTKVLKTLQNSKTKIKRKEAELQELNGSEKPLTIQEQKVQLHRILGVNIDLRVTTMLEWIAYWQEVDLLKRRKKINSG